LAALAEQIRREHAAAEAAWRESVRHALRCGELLIQARAKLVHGQWQSWCRQNLKIAARTIRLYCQLASLPPAERQRVATLPLREALKVPTSGPSFEYWTPAEWIAPVRQVLGSIDLDPASCSEANKAVGKLTHRRVLARILPPCCHIEFTTLSRFRSDSPRFSLRLSLVTATISSLESAHEHPEKARGRERVGAANRAVRRHTPPWSGSHQEQARTPVAAQAQLAQRGALLAAMCEHVETQWVLGKQVDLSLYGYLVSTQRRVLTSIGLERRAKLVNGRSKIDQLITAVQEAVPE
jgi:hypothetical protein